MKWAFDVYHSSVTFTIRHMMSKVRGQMQIKEGWIEVDNDDLSTARVDVVLDAASIDTGVEMRDNHLRSADGHFDVANYPTITFASKRVEGKDPGNFKVIGDLTIHGKTKEVALDASFNGEGTDPRGNRRVSFEAQTKLNRKDYDLTWNQALEAGGFILGDDVKLEIGVEAVPAPTPAEAEKEIEAEVAVESR
ncbi:MAG TPA: YceI family protein [Candidatus Dormibacteraeota bacterium]|jgi:polyisoprenoid-binding protein YceI|nr:YceI family protein [Candidatus Dormibacteraeota bacterium]